MYKKDIKKDDSMLEIALYILTNLKIEKINESSLIKKKKTKKEKENQDENKMKIPNGILFFDLYDKVSQIKEYNEKQKEDNMSLFYTDLMLSQHFIMTNENYWDLSKNYTLAERMSHDVGIYNDDYDEDEIRIAKEKFIKRKEAKGEDVSEIDMNELLEDIDDLLSEEDIEELDIEDSIEE